MFVRPCRMPVIRWKAQGQASKTRNGSAPYGAPASEKGNEREVGGDLEHAIGHVKTPEATDLLMCLEEVEAHASRKRQQTRGIDDGWKNGIGVLREEPRKDKRSGHRIPCHDYAGSTESNPEVAPHGADVPRCFFVAR